MGIVEEKLVFKINDDSLKELRNQRMLDSYAKLLKGHDWKYFITLNFRREVSESRAQEISERFVKALNVRIFGRRSRKALRLAVSIERNYSRGYHLHILAEDPSLRIENKEKRDGFFFRDEVRECWQNADVSTALIALSSPDGKSWFQVIENEDNVILYVLKEMKKGRYDCLQANTLNFDGRRIPI
ncbi:hypothetical protein ACUY1T_19925 [Billgrantia sp. Q4P2]|uniref:hypothetical protein n=1 Tax=Billgrantia sp. Q4P2 TaxID=3463857 RepID=UPI004056F44E